MSGGGAEREGDAESEAGSRLWAVSTEPDEGLNQWTERSWPEPVGRSTNWATQAPLKEIFLMSVFQFVSVVKSYVDNFGHTVI